MALTTDDKIPSHSENKPAQEPSTTIDNKEDTKSTIAESKEEQATDSMSSYCLCDS